MQLIKYTFPENMAEGWFVGFIRKDMQQYIFVTNVTNLTMSDKAEFGGTIAKDITMKGLRDQVFSNKSNVI